MFRAATRLIRPFLSVRRVPLRRFTEEKTFKSAPQTHSFKAETQKILEIVAKSLYMDKEVFIRELVSNSSDALEKQRFEEVSGQAVTTDDLKIKISTDPVNGTFKIFDSGIGMNDEELIKNLGTIAYSGSKDFIDNMSDKSKAESIIGQFGVGFYSSFIVAKEVHVVSKKLDKAFLWTSKGLGDFEVTEVDAEGVARGTEITVYLKDEHRAYANDGEVLKVLKKYSNFVTYPIELNGQRINMQQAIWSRNKSSVTENEYRDFFEYISGQKLPYKYKLHFSLDMPISMKVLLYVPSTHREKFGLSHEEAEVSLYSRKVLIQSKSPSLLPNWMRFMKGVVDCEDIPLNISRETFQDSALMAKIKDILTAKVIRYLTEEATRNEETYASWYEEFGQFMLEAMAGDSSYSKDVIHLLRYSWNNDKNMISLKNYVQNMKPGQNRIYYLYTSNRQQAEDSPYLEPFKPKAIPVIFSHMAIDEMIFRSQGDFQGHKFINIETSMENIEQEQVESNKYDAQNGIPESEIVPFTDWVSNELRPKVSKVILSTRLRDTPAIVVGEMPSALRQAYKFMQQDKGSNEMVKNQHLEINPNHEIIVNLNGIRKTHPDLASEILAQILDNALITADIIENYNPMVKRVNGLMLRLLKTKQNN
jgi:HSP90 family molecular chaperone